jgi:hypothetical protein
MMIAIVAASNIVEWKAIFKLISVISDRAKSWRAPPSGGNDRLTKRLLNRDNSVGLAR